MTGRQAGTAVLFDADHTEATYAAAEALRARFDRVMIVTPRDTIATDVQLVTRQGILRRMAQQRIETRHARRAALERCLRRRAARYRQHLQRRRARNRRSGVADLRHASHAGRRAGGPAARRGDPGHPRWRRTCAAGNAVRDRERTRGR